VPGGQTSSRIRVASGRRADSFQAGHASSILVTRSAASLLVNSVSLCPSYSNTQMTKITRLVICIRDHRGASYQRLLVRRDFKGIETGAAEVDQTSSVPNSCPMLASFGSELGAPWLRVVAPWPGSRRHRLFGAVCAATLHRHSTRIPAPQQHGGFPELRVAVCLHDQHPEVTPVHDDVGNLKGVARVILRGLTGIRTALDGGRREFRSTFDGATELR
jgi:hypothetical protein